MSNKGVRYGDSLLLLSSHFRNVIRWQEGGIFMMKKMVSLLLTAALAVGTLAGCGSAETGAKGDAG